MTAPKDLDSLFQAGSNRLGNAFRINGDRPEIPDWFDSERFDAGREFFRRHVLSVAFGYLCSLYVGFTVDALAKAVSYTGESDTPDRSRHRYLNTMGHLFSWHTSNVIIDQSSIGYRSIRYVRNWHDRVRRRLATNDSGNMDAYVSQYDTALVQAGFVGPIILYPRQLGIRCGKNEGELSDYVYFWRVIGYILGMEDQVNACGRDLATSRTIAKEIELRIIAPGLENPSPTFFRLSQAFVDGMRLYWPWLTSKVIRSFVCRLMGLPAPPDLTWKDYFVFQLLKANFFLMYLIPWYASYWNRKVFNLMEKFLLPAVIV